MDPEDNMNVSITASGDLNVIEEYFADNIEANILLIFQMMIHFNGM